MQNCSSKKKSNSYLRKPEAQAKTGIVWLVLMKNKNHKPEAC